MTIDPNIKQKAENIRLKKKGREVRESLAAGLESMSEDVVETVDRQDYVESQFQEVIDNTTGKDVISAPELIAARNGEANLKARLDKEQQQVSAQLAQTEEDVEDRGFNVRWYSLFAAQDGGDWTRAIQFALDNHNHIVLPKNADLNVTTLNIPSDRVIDGNHAKFFLPPESTRPTLETPSIMRMVGVSNINVFNLEIDGNAANQSSDMNNYYLGVLIQNCENIKIADSYFHNLQRQSIQVAALEAQNPLSKGVYNLSVRECIFDDIWSALQVTQSNSKNIDFSHNNVSNCFEHGVTTYPGVEFVIISNNIIRNVGLNEIGTNYSAGSGIRVFETKNVTISNNLIENPRFDAIRVALSEPVMTHQRSSNIVISGNIVLGGDRKGSIGHGIDVVGDYSIIEGNIVEDFTAYTYGRGINVRGDNCIVSSNSINKIATNGVVVAGNTNIIKGNLINDCSSHSIHIGVTTTSNTVISDNIIKDVLAAATTGIRVDASATNTLIGSNLIEITSSTKIRNLGINTKQVQLAEVPVA